MSSEGSNASPKPPVVGASAPDQGLPPARRLEGSRYGAYGLSVAEAIEADIVARGWPVGTVLGSEEQLIEQYGVSRPVLRQAVRLLRSRGVARSRPGPGGGLVVTAPDPDATLHVARLYLEFRGVQPHDVFEVIVALLVLATRHVAETMDEQTIERLRSILDRHETIGVDILTDDIQVAREIVRLSGNPALEMFASVLLDFAVAHRAVGENPEAAARWLQSRDVRLVEALISGDVALAQYIVRETYGRLESMNAVAGVTKRVGQSR